VFKSLVWSSAALLLAGTAPAWSADLKIGYVNYQALFQQAPQVKVIQATLQGEFGPRQRDLLSQQQTLKTREENLQKNQVTMSDEQRSHEEKSLRDSEREFQLKQTAFQEDANTRRNEELSRLQKTFNEEVRSYAKAQGYDLVLADGVAFATAAVDITPAILGQLEALAKTSAATAPATPPAASATSAKPKTTATQTH
jgi:outer membrane protein